MSKLPDRATVPSRRLPSRQGWRAAALALPAAGALALPVACARSGGRGPSPGIPDGGAATAAAGWVEPVAPGVVHRRLAIPRGPWVVHVLDVALDSCWTFAARKAGGQAVGRLGTRALAGELAAGGQTVAGAVNADFFTFRPPGTTENVHVERGDLVLGPSDRPVFAVRSDGRPWIGHLGVRGRAVLGADTVALTAWNRGPSRGPAAAAAPGAESGVALFDARYGARTDSAPGRLFVRLAPVPRPDARPLVGAVLDVDSGAAAVLPAGGYVLAVGPSAPAALRARLARLRPGVDTARLEVALVADGAATAPRAAVGGWPVLVRDGRVEPALDTVGPAGFRSRNPRSAVALVGARRALLVALDGRRPGYSAGATLPEFAELLRALGATDALNLDGGGSTTLVVAGPAGAALRIVNRPSDEAGERPVANALAVVRGCR